MPQQQTVNYLVSGGLDATNAVAVGKSIAADLATKPTLSTDALGNVTGLMGIAMQQNRTIAFCGDSITALAGLQAGNPNFQGRGFWCWGQSLSGHKLRALVNTGVPGTTTAQILSQIPTALAYQPGYLHYLGGTNDVGNSVSLATTQANILSALSLCKAAGVLFVIGTIPPRQSYTAGQQLAGDQINAWIKTLPYMYQGVQVIDYYATLATQQNGIYVTGYSYDNAVHPSQLGAYAMGTAYAAWANGLNLPPPTLTSSDVDGTNYLTNGRMTAGGVGSGTGNAPTGWFGGMTGGSVAYSKTARTDGVQGSWQTVTQTTSGCSGYLQSTNIAVGTLPIGTAIELIGEYQLSGLDTSAAANTQWFNVTLQFYNGASFFFSTWDLYDDVTNENQTSASRSGVFRTPVVRVPVGTTVTQVVLHMNGSGVYNFDRVTLRQVPWAPSPV